MVLWGTSAFKRTDSNIYSSLDNHTSVFFSIIPPYLLIVEQ